MSHFRFHLLVLLLWFTVRPAGAQAVNVTMSVNRPLMLAGETATLRVFGRIKPAFTASTDRIFSWYIDVTNTAPAAIRVDWNTMIMSGSDSTPGLFSAGVNQGTNNRRGIYNTYLNFAGAGRLSDVELFNVRLTALTDGPATFAVSAGTGVANLSSDFIVANTGGAGFLTGGDYAAASVTSQVIPLFVTPAALVTLGNGSRRVDFPLFSGFNHRVEYSPDLVTWTNSPTFSNSGSFTDAASGINRRFYRVRLLR